MNRIYKYTLELVDKQTIELPRKAEILSVLTQRDNVVLYALVDDGDVDPHDLEAIEIRIVGTGHAFVDRDEYVFLGTVMHYDGDLIWHIFRRDATPNEQHIRIGDTVHTCSIGGKFKVHRVTQIIDSYGTSMLILDSGKFASSINAALLEWHSDGWFEKVRDRL